LYPLTYVGSHLFPQVYHPLSSVEKRGTIPAVFAALLNHSLGLTPAFLDLSSISNHSVGVSLIIRISLLLIPFWACLGTIFANCRFECNQEVANRSNTASMPTEKELRSLSSKLQYICSNFMRYSLTWLVRIYSVNLL
jgi:hypothetical protein